MSDHSTIAAIRSKKHWIFDLDGTLTIAVHDFPSIKTTLGVPADTDILTYLAALPLHESVQRHRELDEIEQRLSRQAVAAIGALELLTQLTHDQCKIGILTRNSHDVACQTLEYAGLGEFFSDRAAIIGRYNAAPKPDPEGAQQLALYWDTTPNEMILTGDYLYDLQCGKNAGTLTVHVDPSGAFRWNELADLKITSLAELAEIRACTA